MHTTKSDIFMLQAMQQARAAGQIGEVPVGCAIVHLRHGLIGVCGNLMRTNNDPTAHAEMLCIRQAGQYLGSIFLDECVLYTTLEPCPMCAMACSLARVKRIYYACEDPKRGAIESVMQIFESGACQHRSECYQLFEYRQSSSNMLKAFFENRR